MLVSSLTRQQTNLPNKLLKKGLTSVFRFPKCHLKKLLRNLSLNKWQQDWDTGDTWRAIFNILPKVTITVTFEMRRPAGWWNDSSPVGGGLPMFNIPLS
ncbi:hypothetical protein AVEN_55475-1 [Araneus ventricosus]|uniref:Uncharacterized protein n=1 Tax=Araneus ventricosus TaxID=182803 RepID=A0A4Y2S3V6_ARAVE|nr:hypothetical protein AVEN_55475-1 [Araneus ventricosus]